MAVICKKCGGQHPMWDCKATAAQIATYKSSGGSSAVERQPSKLGVEGSTPSRRSKPIVGPPKDGPAKKSRPVRAEPSATQNTSIKQRPKPAAKAGAGRRPPPAPAAKSPVKRPRGRPKTIVDMRAYKAQKERERRARLKQGESK